MTPEQTMAGPDRPLCASPRPKHPGTTCGLPAGWGTDHPGFGRCKLHLGTTANHREHARQVRERVQLAIVLSADQALARLKAIIDDDDAPPQVQLAAARDILDRAGLGARNVLLLGEAPPELLDERRTRIAADLESLLAGRVIPATVADDQPEDDEA